MAAINTVFTIVTSHLLGEAEDWCLDLSIGVELEGGTLCVYGVGNDGVRAFTQGGIENLRQITSPTNKWPEQRHPRLRINDLLPCGLHYMLRNFAGSATSLSISALTNSISPSTHAERKEVR